MKNSKDSTKKLLEPIKEFSKVAGYQKNFQKLIIFLYTNNELSERETEKTIPFTIASKKIFKDIFNQGGIRLELGKL